jgi:transcriptional regulator with XRE-family HTH domain
MTLKTIYQDRYVGLINAMTSIRKEHGLTQTQVASQLGKPQSYVAKVENFERTLDVVEFVDWCLAIDADATLLISQFLAKNI